MNAMLRAGNNCDCPASEYLLKYINCAVVRNNSALARLKVTNSLPDCIYDPYLSLNKPIDQKLDPNAK
jgi:hypothetical protein